MDQIIQWSNFGMYEMECVYFYIFNSCLKASFSTRPFNTHIPDILLSKTLILDTRSFVKEYLWDWISYYVICKNSEYQIIL